MKEYFVNTYTIDNEWKEANSRKYESENYMEYFMEDVLNSLCKLGYKIEQIVRVGANFVTIMYSGGN